MKHIYDKTPSEDRFADRLREVAQSYEPPFELADWAAMQQKLAQHNQKTVYKRLVAWVGASAAAVVVFLVSYHAVNTYVPTQEHQLVQHNTQRKSNFSKKTHESSYSLEKETITTTSAQVESLNNTLKSLKGQLQEAALPTNTQNNLTYSSPVTNFGFKVIDDKENVFVESSAQHNTHILSVTAHQNESLPFMASVDLQYKNDQLIEALGTIKYPNMISPLQIAAIDAPTVLEEVERTTAVASAEGKWRLGLALKAMVNFYKSDNQLRINYNNGYGLLVDRQIDNSFTISAGAIYSEKHILIKETPQFPNLAALDENETAWIQKNTTQVNWKLIDLPLNVRYNAIQTPRNKWFFSTGISNYFFVKENYESDYTVSTPDIFDPRVTRTQAVIRQRETEAIVQPLATLNVSFGLETSLGKRLTLQVEPYWNFPIRSLGSEGVFVQTGGLLTRINFAR